MFGVQLTGFGRGIAMNCKTAEGLLSDHIDNALSARETLALDKHLAECNHCARLSHATRRTVAILADAPRFEVSADFMSSLQSRIDHVQNAPARTNWPETVLSLFRPRLRPAWGAAVGVCVVGAMILANRLTPVESPAPLAIAMPEAFVQQARTQTIALVASDPFGDTAAASLAASATSVSSPHNPASTSGEPIY